jgi:hypothetical protein
MTTACIGSAKIVTEVKIDDDPFVDTAGQGFYCDSPAARKTLGQIVSHASHILTHHYPRFCFTVLVVGKCARLLRWDRAGVIVSSRIDYVAHPEQLCKLFWLYAHADASTRGYDTSIRQASKSEEEVFRDTIHARLVADAPFLREDTAPGAVQTADDIANARMERYHQLGHVVAIKMKGKEFLVSRPLVSPSGIVSRATRAYWAVEAVSKKVVFLKDSWRYDVEWITPEGVIHRRLNEKKVANIATLVCEGDVHVYDADGQETGKMPVQ